jgi:hypothetical protein
MQFALESDQPINAGTLPEQRRFRMGGDSVTDKQAIQRWTTTIFYFEVEESDDVDFVLFDDHERIVSDMQNEIDKLKIEIAFAMVASACLIGIAVLAG